MSKKLKNRNLGALALAFVVGVSFFFASCKDNKPSNTTYDPSIPVTFDAYTPDSGGSGTQMIISGTNFGSDTSLVHVTINGSAARVIGVNGTHLYTVVPTRADSGKVQVTVGEPGSTTATVYSFPNTFAYIWQKNVTTVTGQTNENGDGGFLDGTYAEALFKNPCWLTIEHGKNTGNAIYVLEDQDGNKDLRMLRDGMVTTPLKASGLLKRPRTIALSLAQDTMFMANDNDDGDAMSVCYLTRATGWMMFTPLARTHQCNGASVNPVNGAVVFNRYGDAMLFHWDWNTMQPVQYDRMGDNGWEYSSCFSQDGKTIYIIVRNHHYIMKGDYDTATGAITNVINFAGRRDSWGFTDGLGTYAQFNQPCEGVCDVDGNLYVADRENNRIRKITPDGVVSTYAGTGERGYSDGIPLKAKFKAPEGLAIDDDGVIYVADRDNHRIRKIVVQ